MLPCWDWQDCAAMACHLSKWNETNKTEGLWSGVWRFGVAGACHGCCVCTVTATVKSWSWESIQPGECCQKANREIGCPCRPLTLPPCTSDLVRGWGTSCLIMFCSFLTHQPLAYSLKTNSFSSWTCHISHTHKTMLHTPHHCCNILVWSHKTLFIKMHDKWKVFLQALKLNTNARRLRFSNARKHLKGTIKKKWTQIVISSYEYKQMSFFLNIQIIYELQNLFQQPTCLY